MRLVVKYARFDKISNEKLKQFEGKNDVSKSEKFSFAPPLYKCIVVLLAAAAFILTACSGLQEDGGEKNIRINLPPIVSASGNSRALSGDRLPTLKEETRRYRVTVNGMTREGTGSSYEFTLAVGIRATAIIECLNSSGEVIIRAVKDFTVSGGDNIIDINLKNDGNEIIPSAPQPLPNQVTYSYGDANNGGEKRNLPANEKVAAGETFTVPDVSQTIYWAHGNFTGWKTNVALVGDTDSNTTDVQANSDVQAGGKYKMPAGGVTLTAQWNKKPYNITYNTTGNAPSSATVNPATIPATTQNALTQVTLASAPIVTNNPVSVSGGDSKKYTFTYWKDINDGGKTYNAGVQVTLTKDMELEAVWSDEEMYTVSYNWGNQTPSDTQGVSISVPTTQNVVKGGTATITIPTDTVTGYDFLGWSEDQFADVATYKAGSNTISNISRNYTLYAVWKIKTYNITYSMNAPAGTTGTGIVSPTTREYGQVGYVLATNTFIVPGYDFAGWYDGNDATASKVGNSGETVNSTTYMYHDGDLTLYAKWNAQQYNITYYDVNANSTTTSLSGTHGSGHPTNHTYGTATTLVEPTKPNYKFLGWFTANNGSGSPITELAATGYTGSITLYAKWEPKQYNISYNFGSGQKTTDGDATFTIETTSITFATGALQDYVLSAWKVGNTYVKNTDISQLVSLAENSGDSITLEAEFLPSGKMIIESKAVITGRGTTVTGNIPPGMTINVNDTVTIQRGDGSTKDTVITGIEQSGTQVADTMTATEKTTVTLLLRGVAESEVNPNDVLAW